MKRIYPIGLLVVERGADRADALITRLRLAGFAVRPRWVSSAPALQHELREGPWDVLLIAVAPAALPVAEAMELVANSGVDLAVIGVAGEGAGTRAEATEALAAGLHDLVPREWPQRLEHAVRRELASLEHRRAVRRLNVALADSSKTLRELLEAFSDAAAFTHRGALVYANQAFLELFGFGRLEEAEGRPLADFFAEGEREELRSLLDEHPHHELRPVEIELTGRHQKAGELELWMEIAPATYAGRAGHRIIARPRRAPRADAARASAEEWRDHLTGLSDRRRLVETLNRTVQRVRESDSSAALVYLEIANFLEFRSNLSLLGLDRLVFELAAVLQAGAPRAGVLGHVSDDAFALLLPEATRDDAERAAASLRACVDGRVFVVEERPLAVSCATGVAVITPRATGGAEILDQAREACVRADGSPAAERAEQDGMLRGPPQAVAANLRDARTDGRLSLVFQPIVRLHGEMIELYEVFMRLTDRDGTAIPTELFLLAADRAQVATELDLWVLERAIDILSERHRAGRGTHLFVKLSNRAVEEIDVPLGIIRRLKRHGESGRRLIVEVSETVVAERVKAAKAFVSGLKKVDCLSALDHFGVSLKSFELLHSVPVDYLKLDPSLVSRIAGDAATRRRVTTIAERARALDKHVIATCVEDARTLAMLYEAGVEFAQGCYIAEPMASMDFEFSIVVE